MINFGWFCAGVLLGHLLTCASKAACIKAPARKRAHRRAKK